MLELGRIITGSEAEADHEAKTNETSTNVSLIMHNITGFYSFLLLVDVVPITVSRHTPHSTRH